MKKGIKYLVSIIIAVMIFILATNIFAIEKVAIQMQHKQDRVRLMNGKIGVKSGIK